MKRKPVFVAFAVLAVLAAVCSAIFLCERPRTVMTVDDEASRDALDSLSDATRMKVVVLPDGTVARYVSEDDDTYTGDIQDTFTVGKEGAGVEVWSASEGKGVVYMKEPGEVQVLCEPDPTAGVICDLSYGEGECPCTYGCRGLSDGWYEIELRNGKSGYVRAQYMNWDAIDTF